MTATAAKEAIDLAREWAERGRWDGIERDYSAEDVVRLRGSVRVEHTLARRGAEKLWRLLHEEDYVPALGALTGGQAVQMVKAGLKAIYLSGWQVAADGNLATQIYPDQSLYPANSVPAMVRRLNNALLRADQIDWAEGKTRLDWLVPIVADAEAGFGGPLNAFELMKGMIESGAAAVHFEDQLAAEKKCGHLGGKVLVPTGQFIRTLLAARLAADVLDVPTLRRRPHRRGCGDAADERRRRARRAVRHRRAHPRGLLPRHRGRRVRDRARSRLRAVRRPGLDGDVDARPRRGASIRRGDSRRVSRASCSPTTARPRSTGSGISTTTRSPRSRRELGALGYKFQFITLAGFHALNESMFELARGYAAEGMSAYVRLQQREFGLEEHGYTATRHQREVGAGYFDEVAQAVSGGQSSTLALKGSTEEAQFEGAQFVENGTPH